MILGLKSVRFGVTDFCNANAKDARQDDVNMDADRLRLPENHFDLADMARVVEDLVMLRRLSLVSCAGWGEICMEL